MKRCFALLLLLVMLFCFSLPAFAQDPVLVISGDGVNKEVSFTAAELAALPQEQAFYTCFNNFPTAKQYYVQGVTLRSLLELAGIHTEACSITVAAADGYNKSFLVEQLLNERYSFDAEGKKTAVPAMIALQISEQGYDSLEPAKNKLVAGQLSAQEQNNPWFVDGVATVTVSTERPVRWMRPICTEEATEGGILLTPTHPAMEGAKIYYTTDGSDPTVESAMYNVSAQRFQPELNLPIMAADGATVKLIAIGPGRPDSMIETVKVSLGGEPFKDLLGYNGARDAIQRLKDAGVINGMDAENTVFEPSSGLTRAQFAKMLVLAMGDKAVIPEGAEMKSFSDVAEGQWFYEYVQQAAALGLVEGYTDGSFGPDKPVNRQEMLKMLACALGEEIADEQPGQIYFAKDHGLADWAAKYAFFAWDAYLVPYGYTATADAQNLIRIDGAAPASRAEAAIGIDYLMERLAGKAVDWK